MKSDVKVEEEIIKVKETVYDWEHLNTIKPIWVRKPEEVKRKRSMKNFTKQ